MTDPDFEIVAERSGVPFRQRIRYDRHVRFDFGTGANVYVVREVAARLLRRAREAEPRETGGLLAGRAFYDDEGPYLIVTDMAVAPPEAGGYGRFDLSPEGTQRLRDFLAERQPSADVVGWWHSHPAPSVYSVRDRQNQAIWTSPLHIGLLVFPHGSPWARLYVGPSSAGPFDSYDAPLPPRPLGAPPAPVEPLSRPGHHSHPVPPGPPGAYPADAAPPSRRPARAFEAAGGLARLRRGPWPPLLVLGSGVVSSLVLMFLLVSMLGQGTGKGGVAFSPPTPTLTPKGGHPAAGRGDVPQEASVFVSCQVDADRTSARCQARTSRPVEDVEWMLSGSSVAWGHQVTISLSEGRGTELLVRVHERRRSYDAGRLDLAK